MDDLTKLIIENLQIPILCFNTNGKIVYANNYAKEIFGSQELNEKPVRNIFNFPETVSIEELISNQNKINLTTPIGEVLYDFTITGNKAQDIAIAYGQDVTQLKRKERSLNLALEQVDEVKKLEEDFLAKVSHEIRSPLLVIEGFTELLIGELDNKLRNEFEPFFFAINNSSKRLYRAFDLVMYNYQLQTRTYTAKHEKINLYYLLTRLHQEFYSFSTEKNIKFLLSFDLLEDPLINADSNSVDQIFAILLDNAFKYTNKGKITIRIYDLNGKFAVDVADTGTGITDELYGILNRYFSNQHKGSLNEYDITGLGLETVKKFAILIDAELKLRSKIGEGSIFTILFDKYIPAEEEKTKTREEDSAKIFYLPTIKKPGNY